MNAKKRFLSLLLCAAMLFSGLPVTALAEETEETWENKHYLSEGSVTITDECGDSCRGHLIDGSYYTGNENVITVTGGSHRIRLMNVVINVSTSAFHIQNDAQVELTLVGTNNSLHSGWGGGSNAGLQVAPNASLTIKEGILRVEGGRYGAGIGGGWEESCGDITINGGTITAIGGGGGAAGIGGGDSGSSGPITITGGTITATGGYGAAGIGGGVSGSADAITITGGTVMATGGKGAAGIGGGKDAANHGTFSTAPNGDATIIAIGGQDDTYIDTSEYVPGGRGIGDISGQASWTGSILVIDQYGGGLFGGNDQLTLTQELMKDLAQGLTLPEGLVLDLKEGQTLTVGSGVTLTNNGLISGAGLLNGEGTGTVVGSGTMTVENTFQAESAGSLTIDPPTLAYGGEVTLTAKVEEAGTNSLTRAAANQVEFFVGTHGDKTSLGSAPVQNGAATLTLTLSGETWEKGFAIGDNAISAEYGGTVSLTPIAEMTGMLTVKKATQDSPPAPTLSALTATGVTLNTLSDQGQGALQYGYQTGEETEPGHWQASPGFTGLKPLTAYTFYARFAGTGVYEPAVSSNGLSVVTPPDREMVSIDYRAETVAFDSTSYEVNSSADFGAATALIPGGSLTELLDNNRDGFTLYVRRADSSGPVGTLQLARPAMNSLYTDPETVYGSNDGKIIDLDASKSYEYRVWNTKSKTWGPWQAVAPQSTEISPLAPGRYEVRIPATDASFASASQEWEVEFGYFGLYADTAHFFFDSAEEAAQEVEIYCTALDPENFTLEQPTAEHYTISAVEQDYHTYTFTIRPKGGQVVNEAITIKGKAAGQYDVSCTIYAQKSDTSWYTGHESAAEYTLTTAEQLAGLSRLCYDQSGDEPFAGKTVRLGGDIDLSSYNWQPIIWKGGVFDGGGHAITGLKVTHELYLYYGLYVGGLFAYTVEGTTLQNFTVSGAVDIRTDQGGSIVAGGVVGYNACGTLVNIGSEVDVSLEMVVFTGDASAGGIAGVTLADGYWGPPPCILNSYATGRVSAGAVDDSVAGGIAGQTRGDLILNCYYGGPGVTATSLYETALTAGIAVSDDAAMVSRCYSNITGSEGTEDYFCMDGSPFVGADALLTSLNDSDVRQELITGHGVMPLPWDMGDGGLPVHRAPQSVLTQPTSVNPLFSVTTGAGEPTYQWEKLVTVPAAPTGGITNDGSTPWTASGSIWQSTNHDDSSTSTLKVPYTVAEGQPLAFRWKVSSEEEYDFLRYTLTGPDGFEKNAEITGTDGDWETVAFTGLAAGTYTLTVTYVKDNSRAGGDDCGWVNLSPQSVPVWQAISGQTAFALTSVQGLEGETVRCVATYPWGETLISESLTADKAIQLPPDAPELESRTSTSITLRAIDPNGNGAAAEYSRDGGTTWQSSPIFTELEPGTAYTFVARYQAVEDYEPSTASPGAEYSTENSGGGGSPNPNPSNPTYRPDVEDTEGGDVSIQPSNPHKGDEVIITPKPEDGYEVEDVIVTDKDGKPVSVTDNGDGTWTFTQPTGSVTVEVIFRETPPEPLPFTDVPEGAWYYDAVRYVYEHGLMTGTSETTFAPNSKLTRAQAVQILYNLEGQPEAAGETTFTDVKAGQWYETAILWAEQTGVVDGYGDGTFQPDKVVTREEFAQMMYNYAVFKKLDTTAQADLSQFPDGEQVSVWAESAMSWANGNGLINGHDDGTIDARGTTLRSQAASILMNFDLNLVK